MSETLLGEVFERARHCMYPSEPTRCVASPGSGGGADGVRGGTRLAVPGRHEDPQNRVDQGYALGGFGFRAVASPVRDETGERAKRHVRIG